jgi:hypothetical protein
MELEQEDGQESTENEVKSNLTDSEILNSIETKANESYGYMSSTLNAEREQALDYYLGKPYGNEVDGRSQVVTRDTLETIEWMLPSLLKIFTAGDKAVEFQPKGAEDVDAAEQETSYVNHVVMQQNDSFMTLYTFFKDALMMKTGYVKIYWDTKEDVIEDTYANLSEEELVMLAQDKGVEIVSAEQTELGYNITVKRVTKNGRVCIEPVPPEEILVDMACRKVDLSDANFIEHRTRKTISDIRLMGFDVEDNIADYDESTEDGGIAEARNLYDEDADGYEGADPSTRMVWFRDVTIRIDSDGDGIAELMRYYIVGDKILYRAKAENVYYAALCPLPMPHRHVGLSLADLVQDVQLIRSTIMRQYLDGLYLSNNGRYAISDRVNLDDMLVSRPGGIVRVQGDPGASIMPLVHPNTGAGAIEGLTYLDSQKEARTGITKYNQGLDANSLNKTATGINQIMGAAQQRMELVARIFAESGVKRMFQLTHELLKKHADKATIFRLNNKWVPVDPRQWQTRTDMTIAVGLGTGNKDAQLAHLMSILQVQREAMAIGVSTPKNIYLAAKRLAENAGFSDGNEFFTDPEQQQPQQPQANPLLEVEQVKQQGQMQTKQMDLQAEQQKFVAETELEKQKMAVDYQQKKELEQMQIISNERIKAAEIEASKEAKLMELAAGIISAQIGSAQSVDDTTKIDQAGMVDPNMEVIREVMQSIQGMASALSAPKYIVRDANGRAVGVQSQI